MFGRKDSPEEALQEIPTQGPVAQRVPTEAAVARTLVPPPSPLPAVARRSLDLSHNTNNRRHERTESIGERKLIVGKGLSLSGEITSCDVLVVEGKVEAKLTDGKLLEISESGQFRGTVEIENADIAGRYDGQLTVHGRLTLRGTGRISGTLKYGELEVNAGGQIIGEMQVIGDAPATTGKGGFKNAAKMAAVSDDEDEAPANHSRKAGNA